MEKKTYRQPLCDVMVISMEQTVLQLSGGLEDMNPTDGLWED